MQTEISELSIDLEEINHFKQSLKFELEQEISLKNNIQLIALKYKKLICLVAETCFAELNSGYKSLLESLSDFCGKKTEDSEWEEVPEKFKKFSSSSCSVLAADQALQRVVMQYT